jgi:hypothetical protein
VGSCGDIPSARSGTATGAANATATRDKRAMIEYCILTVDVRVKVGRPATMLSLRNFTVKRNERKEVLSDGDG